jgi:ATP-dependent Zn protease
VKGNPEAIEDLRDIVDYLKNPKKYQEYNIKIPKGSSFLSLSLKKKKKKRRMNDKNINTESINISCY